MKLRDYKTLLATDPHAAMLFDLTERFPRGPTTKLRAHDYKDGDGRLLSKGWGSNEAPYLNRGVESAQGSPMTGGWDPYVIYELEDSEWNLAHQLQQIEVADHIGMGSDFSAAEGMRRLFKTGAQLTRRARRAAKRIREAKTWVQENIGTAVYKVQFGWGTRNGVYVHADSEGGAMTQFELFMKSAFNKHCPSYDPDRISVNYVRPAKTPLELMALNQPFIDEYVAVIEKKRERIVQLQQEIEAMDMAHQVVNIYAINMVATWGTGEGETSNVQ